MTLAQFKSYEVLARKYRPGTFAELVGQDTMVRILRNAFASGRIAHAFILTGVRGVGKTTTARIIAKGLNCTGNGNNAPTTEPCGTCESCLSIGGGHHVDILEMDAASRTGVGDIRDIIESVPYKPATARCKVYIVDEVHMLSTNAFNALLKTLEEPPDHVKFIFATTEIRMVPVTVLSRCQRFDLRRVEMPTMMAHLRNVAETEGVAVSERALVLIARAAEGSVRDAVSPLDQAISNEGEEIEDKHVREMLGLADRGRVLDLFDHIVHGNTAEALEEFSRQYIDGVDVQLLLRDLAETAHWLSVLKVSRRSAEDPSTSPSEAERGLEMSSRLQIQSLARIWQMLLKGMEEISFAPNAMIGAEMIIIRLCHVADLPTPAELLRKLSGTADDSAIKVPKPDDRGKSAGSSRAKVEVSEGHGNVQNTVSAVPEAVQSSRPENLGGTDGTRETDFQPRDQDGPAEVEKTRPRETVEDDQSIGDSDIACIEDLVGLARKHGDAVTAGDLESSVRLVALEPGMLRIQETGDAPKGLAKRIESRLRQWTRSAWTVEISEGKGSPTVSERREARQRDMEARAREHKLTKAVLDLFPEATVTVKSMS